MFGGGGSNNVGYPIREIRKFLLNKKVIQKTYKPLLLQVLETSTFDRSAWVISDAN